MGKIVTKQEFKDEIRPMLKGQGKTIALCHGVFDLVHPGHLAHLKQAKAAADILVVSVTASRFVRKGPGRPYFDDGTRMEFLAAIDCVDHVLLSEGHTVADIVEAVEPDLYVKGEEYSREDEDVTGKIREERELVERHGGRIFYTTGPVWSSTRLINTALSGLTDEVRGWMEGFRRRHPFDEIKSWADAAAKLDVLVVGDVIIDRYSYCDVLGLISKEASWSAQLRSTEDHWGGSVAIARHLASFAGRVGLLSVVGDEPDVNVGIRAGLSRQMDLSLVRSKAFPTIVKQRYLTRNSKREEYRKIFTVNNIPKDPRIDDRSSHEFKAILRSRVSEADVVFLCDFGHGLIDEEAMEIAQEGAKFLALNCQTNSSNMGMNPITKYARADAFTLDQKELKLAFPRHAGDEETRLRALSSHLGCRGWLTRGPDGAWGVEPEGPIHSSPAYTLSVKDTVGAGDAFYAVACIAAAAGAPGEVGLFLGNVAGALGANIVGNREAVDKVDVLKFASTLMNV